MVDQERLVAGSRTRLFFAVSGPLLLLYLLTTAWTIDRYHIDALANVVVAAEFADDADPFVEEQPGLVTETFFGRFGRFRFGTGGATTQYPPGAAIVGAAAYLIWPDEPSPHALSSSDGSDPPPVFLLPDVAPGSAAGAMATAIAMGVLALVFARLTDTRTALAAAYIAGTGTAAWSVAANALWQHGPAAMWLALALYASVKRETVSGLAYGAAILTRPHLAAVAASVGLWKAAASRSFGPLIRIGAGSIVGLGLLIAYNRAVFGSFSISGGYNDQFVDRARSTDLLDYLGNIVLAFVHPQRGLLVFSPFLLVLLPGLPTAWRVAPPWVRGSAAGGLLYLLIQLKANRYSGGDGFWGYRYPIETLVAAAPLLLLSWKEWVCGQPASIRHAFMASVAVSTGLTAAGAILT